MSSEDLARLEHAIEPYRAAGYRIISQTGWSITLIRRRAGFSGLLFILLIFVFWPAAVFYAVSNRNHQDRSVCVRIASDGVIEEIGYTIDLYERDRRITRLLQAVFIILGLLVIVGLAYRMLST